GTADARDRPVLVDSTVLRAPAVRADGRGVDELRHVGLLQGADHGPGAVDVGTPQLTPMPAGLDLPGEMHHRVGAGEAVREFVGALGVAEVDRVPGHLVVRRTGVRTGWPAYEPDHVDVRLVGQATQ